MNHLITKSLHAIAISVACTLFANVALADLTEYSAGHADIGLAITGGDLILRYQFYDGASVLDGMLANARSDVDPNDAYVRVADAAKITALGPAPFLGTTTGDDIWILPQSGTDAGARGVPFLGLNSEGLLGSNPSVSSAMLTLTNFDGPGEFAIWQDGTFGPNVLMQSNDGVAPDDNIQFNSGFHDHINYGFTQEGIYNVELTATANFSGGGSATDVGTFRFLVGSATAIPEPGSLTVLASGLVGMLMRRRRRPQAPGPVT